MDIAISDNGDLFIQNGGVQQLSLPDMVAQRIDHILRSKPGDWGLRAGMGAYIPQYVGYPNIPSTKRLIETEVTEELLQDSLLRLFPIQVEYTPTASNSAMIEITATLPTGINVTTHRELRPTEGLNTSTSLPFTPALYNTNEMVTRTELMTLDTPTNVFEIQYMPINDVIFVLPYSDSLTLDSNGHILLDTFTMSQSFDIASGLAASGGPVLPSGALSYFTYNLDDSMLDIIENNMISIINVRVDDTAMTITTDFSITNKKLYLKEEYSEFQDGGFITHGVPVPSSQVFIEFTYYDSSPIVAVDTFPQDSLPKNTYPRTRIPERNFVTTKQTQPPGTYIIQYLSYEVEVN